MVTFWPHPRTVLQQDARDFRLLTSLEEKKALLAAAGIDRTEVLPFTREFASLKADEYLSLLQSRYGASLIVMGYDNRIGSDRKTAEEICVCQTVGCADPSQSKLWAPPSYVAEGGHRFADVHPSLTHISSTIIRKSLEEGKVEEATEMLGYGYSLKGVVVAGNRLGRTIGFPTANMRLYEPLKLVPGRGVYVVEVEVLGKRYRGMTNIGQRPTVGGTFTTIETHILDFDKDIYGLPLRITFLKRLRDEVHFPSLEALKRQLEMDRDCCREQK